MQQGESQRHSFQVRRITYAVIPLLYNGSCRIGLLTLVCSPVQLGGPFGFCAFALLTPLMLGSLEIALKRTRPRQRFWFVIGRDCMTEGWMCQEEKLPDYPLLSALYTDKISSLVKGVICSAVITLFMLIPDKPGCFFQGSSKSDSGFGQTNFTVAGSALLPIFRKDKIFCKESKIKWRPT